MYGVSPNIESFISDSMTKWNTNLHLRHEKGEIVLRGVEIKRGIFHGDSLSPLLFCLSIDPHSRLLNLKDDGYNMKMSPPACGYALQASLSQSAWSATS